MGIVFVYLLSFTVWSSLKLSGVSLFDVDCLMVERLEKESKFSP